jgi:hypothetical protein
VTPCGSGVGRTVRKERSEDCVVRKELDHVVMNEGGLCDKEEVRTVQ